MCILTTTITLASALSLAAFYSSILFLLIFTCCNKKAGRKRHNKIKVIKRKSPSEKVGSTSTVKIAEEKQKRVGPLRMTPRAMKTAKSNDCGVDSGPTVPTTSPSTTLADMSSLAVISDLEKAPILEAQAEFALNLLRELSNQGQTTTIVSPASVAIALSMVYAGAKGKTAEQMNKLLAKGAPESKVHQFFGQLVSSICSGQNNYTLEVANKVYVKDGFTVMDAFKTTIDQHYAGQFESVNFKEKQETAKKINNFVANATHNKIHGLIKADSLDPLTRLILVNAIYFKGNWADKFDSKSTQKKTFYVVDGSEEQVDMMQKTHEYIYQDAGDYQVLGMPYVGEEVFMFVILPRERFGLSKVLANLTGSKLLELVQNRHEVEVEVTLPKFTLESTHDLKNLLKKLGIEDAFTAGRANFGGITDKEELKIYQVLQKAFIEMNEEGTEAAAATEDAVDGILEEPPKFIADHPFAYMLVLNNGKGSTMLFNGTYSGWDWDEADQQG